MSIQDWGAIGELLGSVVVFVSLVYLAYQVRETRIQARLDSELHLTDQMARHTEKMALDSGLARIIELANNNASELTEDERRRAMWWQVSYLHMMEGLFRRYEKGLLSPEAWEPHERGLAGMFRSEFLPQWWATEMSRLYTESFRTYIDQKLPGVEVQWSHTPAASIGVSEPS
jgi:hypothetical protein